MKNLVKILSCLVIVVVFAFSAFAGTKRNVVNSTSINVQNTVNEKVTHILMPNGKMAFYNWKKDSKQNWVIESIKFEGGKIVRCRPVENGNGSDCEKAAAAAVIAIGICAASPGSLACWSATATAAYMAYLCWKSTRAVEELALEASVNESKKKIHLENVAKIYKFGNPLLNKS